MKKYKIKKSKELIKKLKPFWVEMELLYDRFYAELYTIEKEMSKELEIDNLEFFWSDNEIVGIGNTERTMELIQRCDFDDEISLCLNCNCMTKTIDEKCGKCKKEV